MVILANNYMEKFFFQFFIKIYVFARLKFKIIPYFPLLKINLNYCMSTVMYNTV